MIKVGQWIETHKQQAAAAGAGVGVLVLALFHRSRAANNAQAAGALINTAGVAVPGGGIGVPGTTSQDIQNAVQDQINDSIAALRNANQQQIGAIPRGATGATGAAGPAGATPTMASLNIVRAQQGQPLLTTAQYRAQYAKGKVETAGEVNWVNGQVAKTTAAAKAKAAASAKYAALKKATDAQHAAEARAAAARAAAARKPPAPAPRPKPKPTTNHVVVAPTVKK